MHPRLVCCAGRVRPDWVRLAGREEYTGAGQLLDHPLQGAVRQAALVVGHRVTTADIGMRAGEKHLAYGGCRIPQRRREIVAPLIQCQGVKAIAHLVAQPSVGKFECVEGESRARNIVIEFKDYATALACYRSPEYQRAMQLRAGKAEIAIVVIDT